MVVGCGGGGNGFWVLKPGGGNSNPNAWRAPEGNCKGYKSNGYDGLKNARIHGGNIAASWATCTGLRPIIFDPISGLPFKDQPDLIPIDLPGIVTPF